MARYQLIIDGVATDPNQPVLRRLAEDLHRHHLGAISILPGIEADEIASALHTLAEEQDAGKGARPCASGQLPDWPHLRLHPLTFDRLEIVSDEPSSSRRWRQRRRSCRAFVGRTCKCGDGGRRLTAGTDRLGGAGPLWQRR